MSLIFTVSDKKDLPTFAMETGLFVIISIALGISVDKTSSWITNMIRPYTATMGRRTAYVIELLIHISVNILTLFSLSRIIVRDERITELIVNSSPAGLVFPSFFFGVQRVLWSKM